IGPRSTPCGAEIRSTCVAGAPPSIERHAHRGINRMTAADPNTELSGAALAEQLTREAEIRAQQLAGDVATLDHWARQVPRISRRSGRRQALGIIEQLRPLYNRAIVLNTEYQQGLDLLTSESPLQQAQCVARNAEIAVQAYALCARQQVLLR